MIDTRRIADMIIQEAFNTSSPAEASNPGLTVEVSDVWLPVTRDVWSAWTGRRSVWGIEYHGPVTALGAPEGSPPFTGPRVCRCDTCQAHVDPTQKSN